MKSRATLTVGTAREAAEHESGFSANGESQYSRRAAQPGNVKMPGYFVVRPKSPRHGARLRAREKQIKDRMAHAADITFNEAALAKLVGQVLKEPNPERVAKLRKQIDIKRRWVERLKSENEPS
jgi:hypothetical protein